MAELLFTVVICTYNRAEYLEKALAGIAKQDFPADRFEVLVVDNASTDDTRERVENHQTAAPAIRYIYEPVQGLSVARNTGWQLAAGQNIAYLDDDAIPGTGWLKHASSALSQGHTDIGILGGRVRPIWEKPRPDWLSDPMLSLLSMVDLGPDPHYVDNDFGIVGANMIIPRHLLERFGGFSSQVGRIGHSLLSSEEVLLKRRLARSGYRGFYSPEVSVEHHAPAERLTKEWFLERYYWQGRSSAALAHLEQDLPWWKRIALSGRELAKAAALNVAGSLTSDGFEIRARARGHLGLAAGLIKRQA